MEALIQFLKLLNIETILKQEDIEGRMEVDFLSSAGIWKDHSIDGNQLRIQSWSIM